MHRQLGDGWCVAERGHTNGNGLGLHDVARLLPGAMALTRRPTTTTARAPITLCQRNATFVYVAAKATEAIPAMRPTKAPFADACRNPIARMNTPRIEP